LSEMLGGFYSALEERFFGFADFLDGKGLPVYGLIDALEQRGIPAFPVFTALFLVVLGLVLGLVFVGTSYDVQLTTHFVDQFSQPVSGVQVQVKGEDGKRFALEKDVLRDGETVAVKGVPIGATLIVVGAKEGYLSGSGEVKVNEKSASVAVQLQKEVSTILGRLSLVDSQTKDQIKNAKVVARLSTGEEISCEVEGNGLVSCLGVPEGEDVELKVYADNYEEKAFVLRFSEGSTSELEVPPKASATIGLSNAIFRVFDADSKTLVPEVSVKVYDAKSGELILDDVDEDGEYFTKIAKGTSIRYVVSAEGYIAFDSSVELISKTLRDDSEVVQVELRKGGASIHVTVTAQDSSLVLSNAAVELYDAQAEFMDSGLTQFGGDVYFRNLDAQQKYYVTANAERYLPARIEVNAQQQTEYTLPLARAAPDNSTTLSVFVSDSKGDAANDAVLTFYESVAGGELPLGVSQTRTDITGYAKAVVPVGKTLLVTAVKENEKGEASLATDARAENRLEIFMKTDRGVFALSLVDAQGQPMAAGNIVVSSTSGNVLYSGPVTGGTVYFNPGGLKTVKVSYTGRDGALFEEEVFVEGKNALSLTIGEQKVTGLAPEVQFMGFEDPNGNKVEGIVKGQDYYAVFKTAWPDGKYVGGMHFRFGPDEIRFADSSDAGIIGFTGLAPRFAYGRSYTPQPSPGFEGIDLRNRGLPGEYNRWLELYHEGGAAERVYKVRLKAKETAASSSYPLYYRAWTRIGSAYYRLPRDPLLEGLEFSAQRTGLYAETNRVDVPVFNARPTCKDEFCATYRFLAEDGTVFEAGNFHAVVGNKYALEVEVAPAREVSVTVKGATSRNAPKIFFTGYGVEQFADFPDKDSTDTDLTAKDLKVLPGGPVQVRLYFKAVEKGSAALTVQLISAVSAVTQNFNFEVSQDQGMTATVSPDRVLVGQDFTVLLKAGDGSFVERAVLTFYGEGNAPLRVIQGTGTVNKGLNGLYLVKNAFPAGTLRFTANAADYKPLEGVVEIGRDGVLTAPQAVEVNIPKGQKNADERFDLRNTSSDRVQDLTVEVVKIGDFPEDLDLRVTPPNAIEPNASGKVTVAGEYSGKAERAHGEADVIFRGRIFGKFRVEAQTRVVLDYNRPLDPNCVEFSSARLVTYLLTEPASTQAVQITAKNKCATEVELQSAVVPVGVPDQSIRVAVENLLLGPAGSQTDTRTINVSVVNELERNYAEKQRFLYDVWFRSDLLSKSLPLEVVLWNKDSALQVSRNIDVYLSDTGVGEAKVTVPIYATNVGYADIQNLSFSVGGRFQSGNAKIEIEPKFPVQVLRRGQSLMPPYYVVARAQRTEKTTPLDVQEIGMRGIINGKTHDFGPIIVTVHISPKQCLVVSPAFIEFKSKRATEGALQEALTVKNSCAEEVRVLGAEPKRIGANELDLAVKDTVLFPGASTTVNLTLKKNEAYFTSSPVPVYLRALLVRSNKFVSSQPISVQLELGKSATLKGEAATEPEEIPVCDKNERKKVSFPKIAKQADCDKAYCDAEQLGQFLAKRIQEKLRDAQKQITAHYKNEVANTGCYADNAALNEGYCLFENLGLRPDKFEVYFANDVLSVEALKDGFAKKAPELNAYNVKFPATEDEYRQSLATGYGKQLFFSDAFEGCGLYKARLSGAVKVQGGRMITDAMDVYLDLRSELEEGENVRQLTQQCENKIQNAMAFLPLDAGYSADNTRNAWPGLVTYADDKMEGLAKEFASSLFNSDKRVRKGEPEFNRVRLATGDTQGYLVKLDLIRSTEAGQKMTINALVKDFEGGEEAAKAKVEKQIVQSAALAMRELSERKIDGCITDNENAFWLKSTEKIGQLELNACPNPLTVSQNTACCDFNVFSDVSEPVKVSVKQETAFNGLKEFYVQAQVENREQRVYRGKPFEETRKEEVGAQAFSAMDLKEKDLKGRYYKNFQVCALGDAHAQMVQGKKLVLGAQSAVHAKKAAKDGTVSLQVCALHPYDFMDRIAKEPLADGETKELYATLGWKGGPDEITLSNLKNLEDAKARMDDATKILADAPAEGQTAYDKKFTLQKFGGLGVFLVGCGSAKFIAAAAGFPVGAFSFFWDCIVPVGVAGLDYAGVLGKVGTTISKAGSGVYSTAKRTVGLGSPETVTEKQVADFQAQAEQIASGKASGKDLEDFKSKTEDMLVTVGIGSSAGKVVIPAIPATIRRVTGTALEKAAAAGGGEAAVKEAVEEGAKLAGAEGAAKELVIPELKKPLTEKSAKKIFGQVSEELATAESNARWTAQLDSLDKTARKTFNREYAEELEKYLFDNYYTKGKQLTETELQEALLKARQEVAPVVLNRPAFRAGHFDTALRAEARKLITEADEAALKKLTSENVEAAFKSAILPDNINTKNMLRTFTPGRNVGGWNVTDFSPGGNAQIMQWSDELAPKIVDAIETKAGGGLIPTPGATPFRAAVRQEVEHALRDAVWTSNGSIAKNQLTAAVNARVADVVKAEKTVWSALAGVQTLSAKESVALGEKEEKIMKDILEEMRKTGVKGKGSGAIKKFFTDTILKASGKGALKLLGGVVSGLFAQFMGLLAWEAYWQFAAEPITPTESIVASATVKTPDGKVVTAEMPDEKFKRGETYKVTMKRVGDFVEKKISLVTDLAAVDQSKKLEDCTGKAFDKDVSKALHNLRPNAGLWGEKGKTEARYVKTYYEAIGHHSTEIAAKAGVPEALLIVLGIWQTDLGAKTNYEYITGCGKPDPKFKGLAESFDCAAGEVKSLLAACPGEEAQQFACVLQAYGKKYRAPAEPDLDELYDTYTRWNATRAT